MKVYLSRKGRRAWRKRDDGKGGTTPSAKEGKRDLSSSKTPRKDWLITAGGDLSLTLWGEAKKGGPLGGMEGGVGEKERNKEGGRKRDISTRTPDGNPWGENSLTITGTYRLGTARKKRFEGLYYYCGER